MSPGRCAGRVQLTQLDVRVAVGPVFPKLDLVLREGRKNVEVLDKSDAHTGGRAKTSW
jgi:hypothetical protein